MIWFVCRARMDSQSYDITIIGAGPSGATLARLLDRRWRVLIVDPRDLAQPDGGLRKACGALVAPDAQAVLARLGLGLPKEVLVGPQLFGVRALDLGSGRERFYQRHYLNTDRERFDRWLFAQVPDTVERRLGTRLLDGFRDADGFTLRLRHGTTGAEVRTRVLVGADGARSKVQEVLGPKWRTPPRAYLAVQAWYAAEGAPAHFGVYFDSGLTDFYGWSIPKDDALLLGVALPPGPGLLARFQDLKARLERRGMAFGRLLRREAHPILRPGFATHPGGEPGSPLLIGEAGGFISPSSAEGFSYAFRSAIVAAQVLNGGLDRAAARFGLASAGLRWDLRLKCLKAPFMYHPLLRNLILASGIRHLEGIRPGSGLGN